jgi:hypothetical protein
VYGIVIAVLVISTALLAAVWVIGMAAKAALFGDPKASLVMKLFERAKASSTDITNITPDNRDKNGG